MYSGDTTIYSRSLESNNVVRATVKNIKLVDRSATRLIFETEAIASTKKQISSADSEMMNQADLAKVGEKVTGRLAIDFLTDDLFRVRYSEGEELIENHTPMVVGEFSGPSTLDIDDNAAPFDTLSNVPARVKSKETGCVEKIAIKIRTSKICIHINCVDYRIEVSDIKSGKRICGIGGPEKNNFNNWDSFNTGVNHTVTEGQAVATESFDLMYDECVYGLGEKFIKLNKVGQTIDLDMGDALGVMSPRSYKNIPFFISNKGYGVFFNHSSRMTYWLGSMSASDIQVSANDNFIDYYVMTGSIKEVLSRYTDITGKGQVPPKWTFGYWQSKISYSSAEETLEIARELRKNKIPCDVIHLDTHWFQKDWYCDLLFDKERFPDPAAYMKELADMGFKISLWQIPYIPEGSKLFADLKDVDGFVKTEEGDIYNVGICFTPGFKGIVGVVDYTNPAAVKVHQEAFAELFKLGAKVIKTDFGEDAPLDGVYHNGMSGHQMHNLYPLIYNEAIAEITEKVTGDAVVWARSAWAGSQRYPIHWGGDNSPNYFNCYPQLQGGLSFGLSGFQFWSEDIGGFLGETNEALLTRWMQLGMFLSHSRIHGSGDRELYKFSKECVENCKKYIDLRYRLMPYIYSNAVKCVEQSIPMVRALVVDFQDDCNTYDIGDEYLFGDDILVAPIFTEFSDRKVYFPECSWTDWWSGEIISGNTWKEVNAEIDTIPLYIKEGGIVPMGPVMNYVDEVPTDELEVRLGLFTKPGKSTMAVVLTDESIELTYEFDGAKHKLSYAQTDKTIEVSDALKKTVTVAQR